MQNGILDGILEIGWVMSRLTELKAKNIQPGSRALPHGGVVGLSLHPSAVTKGQGKWVLRYVSPMSGKRRNAGLGSYPEVGIAQAAKEALLMRDQVGQGLDPLDERDLAKQKFKGIPTFKQATLILHAALSEGWRSEKHGRQWLTTLEQYVFPVLGSVTLDQLQPSHIAAALKPIWLSKPETAGRVKQRIHAVMAWGWAHGYCVANPVDVVVHLLAAQPNKATRTQHQPAMPWQSVPQFVREHVANEVNRYDVTRALLMFLILTASRSGEARGMKWPEVDFDNAVWTVPAERMKSGVSHRVPLSKQALNVLEKQKGLDQVLVFPSIRKRTMLSDMVLTSFLRRHDALSDVPGRVATAHGFRSSFRDWCSEHGYARDLAEKALAHTLKNKVEAAYNRTDLLEQRRGMMADWANFVT